jgi:hypothetical protein
VIGARIGGRPFSRSLLAARCNGGRDRAKPFTHDPDDGRFNAEFIVIKMENGKVGWANYLED